MPFTLSLFREFIKFFIRVEGGGKEDKIDTLTFNVIGNVKVKTPEKEFEFPLAVTIDDAFNKTASLFKSKDGAIRIVFYIDFLSKLLNHPFRNALLATCAHEVGHYLAGHFDNDTSSAYLNVKPEIQQFFFNRYSETKDVKDENNYMRCVATCLLKGGVIVRELEADIQALNFIDLADVVHMHSLDFDNKKNPFTVLEKVNRIKQLNAYAQKYEIDTEGYELLVEFYQNKSKEN